MRVVVILDHGRGIADQPRPLASVAATFDFQRRVRDAMNGQRLAHHAFNRIRPAPRAKVHHDMRVHRAAVFVDHPQVDMVNVSNAVHRAHICNDRVSICRWRAA